MKIHVFQKLWTINSSFNEIMNDLEALKASREVDSRTMELLRLQVEEARARVNFTVSEAIYGEAGREQAQFEKTRLHLEGKLHVPLKKGGKTALKSKKEKK